LRLAEVSRRVATSLLVQRRPEPGRVRDPPGVARALGATRSFLHRFREDGAGSCARTSGRAEAGPPPEARPGRARGEPTAGRRSCSSAGAAAHRRRRPLPAARRAAGCWIRASARCSRCRSASTGG
jgi:hypothetical protein